LKGTATQPLKIPAIGVKKDRNVQALPNPTKTGAWICGDPVTETVERFVLKGTNA
jgi:hypothetical protein